MSKARNLITELMAASAPGEEIGAVATGGGGGGGGGRGPDGGGGGRGGGDSGDGWKNDGPPDGDFPGLTYDLLDQAGVVSSSHSNYDMSVNRAGWQKFVELISAELGKTCTLKDAVAWILKSGPMPGIETLWAMTQDPRLKPLTDFDDASASDGADNLCVSYFYGGHERRAAFVKYGSHDPEAMAKSVYNCLDNLHNGVKIAGTTVTMPAFDDNGGDEWGPGQIVTGLREGGWQVDFDNDGQQFTITIHGFGSNQ